MRQAWLAGLAALGLAGTGAEAQVVVTDPAVVGWCLCGQRFVDALYARVEAAQRDYEDAHARLQALDNRVNDTRPTVDTDDPGQVDAFRRLVREDEIENAHFFNDVLPHQQALVARYNRRLTRYTAACGGRSFEADALAQAKATLSCGVDQDDEP